MNSIRYFLAVPFAVIGVPLTLLGAYIAGGKEHFHNVARGIVLAGQLSREGSVEL